MGIAQVMVFSWLYLLVVKSEAATFEVNLTNHIQDNTKKDFRRQSTIHPHKQTLFPNKYMKEKYSHCL